MHDATRSFLPMFFILGRPRSGTTLFRMLFDAHPGVIIPPEFPILPLIANKFRHVTRWDEPMLESFLSTIWENATFGHRTLGQLGVDREALARDLKRLQGEVSLGNLLTEFNAHTRSFFPKSEILMAGDKNPLYSIYIPLLMEIFPSAKYICLIRDYRDTFVSLTTMNAPPFEAPNLVLQISRWKYVARRFLHYHRLYPEKFFLLRYEDLVSGPEAAFRKVTDFLGLPFDPSVFNFYLHRDYAEQTYSPENIWKYHKNLMVPVHTGRVNRWREKLTPSQIRVADHCAGTMADILGYERRYTNFRPAIYLRSLPMAGYTMLLFKLLKAGIYFPYPVRRWMASRLRVLVKVYQTIRRNRLTR